MFSGLEADVPSQLEEEKYGDARDDEEVQWVDRGGASSLHKEFLSWV